ncbi:hypothetical protein IMF27_13375 [Pseudomonas sp. PCH199]|uniref:hypothetical protein n=1 Tax=unclassified Pseudomonas TaxID=196821 RepID=UPI000BCF9EA0|nr:MULTISPECIES: hypothetical protein [unclassified Pseudomonas]MCW8276535.1 hypothetical protein [Pseudomonas sp. PCH199]PAM83326.1 hypothetical protein CES87_13670 [Pseudomonas sp. ERMR1:02]
MKTTEENLSSSESLEDVSIVNSLSDEQFKEMSEGKAIKKGTLEMFWQSVIFGYVHYEYHWTLEGGCLFVKLPDIAFRISMVVWGISRT